MIRKLEREDKKNWIKLYCGYAKFLQSPNESRDFRYTLWSWIHNEIHDCKCNLL